MRLATLIIDTVAMPCIAHGDGWLPLGALPGGPWPGSLQALIEAGGACWHQLEQAAAAASIPALTGAEFAPPLARPGKILCLGLNYRDHAAEGGFEIPRYPAIFMRTATSLTAHQASLLRPEFSDKFDYEVELAVIIGQRARHLSKDHALDAVFGYAAFNDASVRDWQKHAQTWTMGKNFDCTGAFGPCIVTADQLPPGAAGLGIRCRVNGTTLQDSNTSEMIFPVAEALAYLSRGMTLEPGDVVIMGTPAGTGFARKPPVWLADGDRVEVEIDGIGVLANVVRMEPAPAAS